MRKFSAPPLAVSLLALALGACASVDYRHQDVRYSVHPIEVIEGNYVESSSDSEIVLNETPGQSFAGMSSVTAA